MKPNELIASCTQYPIALVTVFHDSGDLVSLHFSKLLTGDLELEYLCSAKPDHCVVDRENVQGARQKPDSPRPRHQFLIVLIETCAVYTGVVREKD